MGHFHKVDPDLSLRRCVAIVPQVVLHFELNINFTQARLLRYRKPSYTPSRMVC